MANFRIDIQSSKTFRIEKPQSITFRVDKQSSPIFRFYIESEAQTIVGIGTGVIGSTFKVF